MKKVVPGWTCKTLAEWLDAFPEDTHIDIYSYGVWCLSPGTIKGFLEGLRKEQKSDGRYRCISGRIVKRVYQDLSGYERLIFDIQGDTVHLWNRIMMENKDPDREMIPGLRVPLKDGADVLGIFDKRIGQWRSQLFYIDDFAISCLSNTECLEVVGNDC